MPFILPAGAMVYGFPVVLAIVVFAMCRYDRPWRPVPGNRLQQISGIDTGWRPLS